MASYAQEAGAGFSRLSKLTGVKMPTIRVELFEGRTEEQKAQLAAKLTEVCVEVLGGAKGSVDILFIDVPNRNWATGGILWSREQAESSNGKSEQ
jgi:4-oxalocrotonate tautomerase